MRTVEIIGYERANLGKSGAKSLREEGNVPCVLYGGKEQIHFHTPMYLFKELVYTPDSAFVKINIEGKEYEAILQDAQFHPVSETILHADFLQLFDDKEVKMEIPIRLIGQSPGVLEGGSLVPKIRKIKIKALPKNMPEYIEVDISGLDLGKSVKVGSIEEIDFEILNSKRVSIATVEVPRLLRSAQAEDAAEAEAALEDATETPEEGDEASSETQE